MGVALVIVESPAKANTINKYLGKNYMVKSSIGHVRDLPTSSLTSKISKCKTYQRNLLVNQMGIDPFNGWQATYEILPGKEQLVTELRTLAEEAEHVYLATDLDREGEAIAWHLREAIGGDDKHFSRVVFNEITRDAVTHAFKHPFAININRVNAQQARRFMDRVVGYMVSPLLWKKIARGLSAGRVQSVAVRLVVEREREIKSFMPEEYWELHADLHTAKVASLLMQVTHQQEKPFKPVKQQQINEALAILGKTAYVVSNRDNKPAISQPGAPFTTSMLQQAASNRLGYVVKKTMLLAQKLYEAGYITYMRTDSTYLSQNAINMARCYISIAFGNHYLPKHPQEYISKNNSQEAHEAIRPSDVSVLTEQLKHIEAEAKKLYQLIWSQFVACQMKPAQYNSTILTVTAGEFQLSAYGHMLIFDGWTKVMPVQRAEDRSLPTVEVGEHLILNKLLQSQHFTKPPSRYSEASLVKELEKRGIGRPSTYVSIISTIQERGYVHAENRRFYANKLGEIVTNRLKENFSELMSYDFTAKMEDTLDQVAANQQEWKSVLDTFFDKFSQQLKIAAKDPADGGMRLNQLVITSITCPVCNRKMGIRTASTGVFLGCSGYQLQPKERCKKTIHLIPESETVNIIAGGDTGTYALLTRRRCVKCGTAMDNYIIDGQRKIHVCGNNPLCNGYDIEQGDFRIKGYAGSLVNCEKCGADMQFRFGRFGKYIACPNNDCKNTRKILRNGDLAPPKADPVLLPELPCCSSGHSDAYFVLREGAIGVFLAANTFPKSRETRTPLVAELARFRARLPVKLQYLADAPIEDDAGNSTLVRFSRKTKQQYICSEKDGKATGWTAFYIQGQWQVNRK